ncbi:MAG: hypothetical protein KDA91_05200 [Planctomycetaceae bacterium]|nr:hypothetical protein [Planctomycetaceae bacterium]
MLQTNEQSTARFDAGSFRDRSARVFFHEGQVYRSLSAEGLSDWNAISARPFFLSAMNEGLIVRTHLLDGQQTLDLLPVLSRSDHADDSLPLLSAGRMRTRRIDGQSVSIDSPASWQGVLRHERIPVITYPFEWSFEMLKSAALLTLDLLQRALADDVILKDATPYNVQFAGTRPTFIDTSSFTPLRPGQAWEGYRQFCQLFLYPLMLQAYRGVDFQPMLRGRVEGITPRQMSGLLSFRDTFRAGVFSHVRLHAKLDHADTARSASAMQTGVAGSLAEAGFGKDVILNNLRGLQRIIENLNWQETQSRWIQYDAASAPVQNDGAAKEIYVSEIVSTRHWNQVWDIGCNRGRYSRIAAAQSRCVLAMDIDHLTVNQLYKHLGSDRVGNIIPMVFNLADASPSLGWNGAERKRLEERSHPDLILMLAVIHHLVIGENLLLDQVIDWLVARQASVVIEFVDRDDPQVQSLLANRTDQFPDYSRERFERLLTHHFDIQQRWDLPSKTRSLYYIQPR